MNDNSRLGYVNGYLDGLRDAAIKIEGTTSISHLLKVHKEMLLRELEALRRIAILGDTTADGRPVTESTEPF